MTMAEYEGFVCCFCGTKLTLDSSESGILTLRVPANDAEASQDMYCHAACLREKLSPKFLTLFDMGEPTV